MLHAALRPVSLNRNAPNLKPSQALPDLKALATRRLNLGFLTKLRCMQHPTASSQKPESPKEKSPKASTLNPKNPSIKALSTILRSLRSFPGALCFWVAGAFPRRRHRQQSDTGPSEGCFSEKPYYYYYCYYYYYYYYYQYYCY